MLSRVVFVHVVKMLQPILLDKTYFITQKSRKNKPTRQKVPKREGKRKCGKSKRY